MFSFLKSLTISGGGFPVEQYPKGVTLDLFKYRLNIIYGKNGSGKSTITSAIKDWKDGTPGDVRISFSPSLPDAARESVFIFNEDFIRKNVLERQRGPQTIMMIGSENVSATQKIEELEAKIKELEERVAPLDNTILALDDKKNPSSKEAALNAALTILKADGKYAERATLIKNHLTALGGKNKSKVSEDVIDTIFEKANANNDPDLPSTPERLSKHLESKLNLLCSVSGAQSKIFWTEPQVRTGIIAEEVNALLSRQVIKPELNEREKAIFSVLEDSAVSGYLRQTKRDIIDTEATFCPLCHQPIDSNVRESLQETVTRLLGNEEGAFIASLEAAIRNISIVDFALPAFPDGMYVADIDFCGSSLHKLNTVIAGLTEALVSKRQDIYNASSYRIDGNALSDAINDVKTCIEKLAADVREYNKLIDDNAALQAEAEQANYVLAYMEAKEQIDRFLTLRKKYDDTVRDVRAARQEIDGYKREIRALGLQMRQTATAHDYINRQLANIFYSKDRLSLKGSEDGSYILCSRGKPIHPGKLSTGERNIIALTYFFATLFSGKSSTNRYSEPMLVVIDDPVSSFDSGNRAGISSFLSFEIEKILKGNVMESKVLVFSHDIHTVNDLSRISSSTPDDAPVFREMHNGKLIDIKSRDNEYQNMLNDIFSYADGCNTNESEETAIGNKMRRVLETYSTFMYRCGFKDMCDQKHDYVCDTLPKNRRDFYRAFLGRFILDASSHSNNQVNTLDFTESLYSGEEKKANARNLLTFIYWSNPSHLKAYLRYHFETVERWALEEESGA